MPVGIHSFVEQICIAASQPELLHGYVIFDINKVPSGIQYAPLLAVGNWVAPPEDAASWNYCSKLLKNYRVQMTGDRQHHIRLKLSSELKYLVIRKSGPISRDHF